MKTRSLNKEILLSFFSIIFVLGFLVTILGLFFIQRNIINRAQKEVTYDLKVASLTYQNEIEAIKNKFALTDTIKDTDALKDILGLDYIEDISSTQKADLKSQIAKKAFSGIGIGGTRIVNKEELRNLSDELPDKTKIDIKFTPKSSPTKEKKVENVMAVEYAFPLFSADGKVKSVRYGGKIINKDFSLIDRIHNLVFENEFYANKPIGTVTIFQDDVRISTNVLNSSGQRAIGTRVSKEVYEQVVGEGKAFFNRAFVVTDWYLTAYEPIKDVSGNIIGILYVGILEKPFVDLRKNILFLFLLIIVAVTFLSVMLAIILASKISRPVKMMRKATAKISEGDLEYRLDGSIPVKELNQFAASFNIMAQKLHERDEGLKVANQKLETLNKSYLDMIGFVSHELKGILGSIVMNTYSIKDGYLGPLNQKQQDAVDATAKSLDHFETMVKNYLDLSRIEKGELKIFKSEVDLNEDIIKPVIENFQKQSQKDNTTVENLVSEKVKLSVDKSLITIVCNNLLGNAFKYGKPRGLIKILSQDKSNYLQISFYNDGLPLADSQKKMLFKKFSRLPVSKNIKGTGLGLFIVKEIIEKHGGEVWVESEKSGNTFHFTLSKV